MATASDTSPVSSMGNVLQTMNDIDRRTEHFRPSRFNAEDITEYVEDICRGEYPQTRNAIGVLLNATECHRLTLLKLAVPPTLSVQGYHHTPTMHLYPSPSSLSLYLTHIMNTIYTSLKEQIQTISCTLLVQRHIVFFITSGIIHSGSHQALKLLHSNGAS
jgi:hypothetical protein